MSQAFCPGHRAGCRTRHPARRLFSLITCDARSAPHGDALADRLVYIGDGTIHAESRPIALVASACGGHGSMIGGIGMCAQRTRRRVRTTSRPGSHIPA